MVQTVVDKQRTGDIASLGVDGQAEGQIALRSMAIGCSNPECLKTTVTVTIGPAHYNNGLRLIPGREPLLQQRLLPQGTAQPQPDYIPKAIRDDYYEACLIRDLSPKASATLIRRCLQGMIRDFAGIAKPTLDKEIKALRAAVDDGSADRSITPETIDAIDHVRGIGNIGAHMEKDIDLIVEVDPGEAQALIELVEMLFSEWYVARETRKAKLARLAGIAEEKKAARKALPPPEAEAEAEPEAVEETGAGNDQVNALMDLVMQHRKAIEE